MADTTLTAAAPVYSENIAPKTEPTSQRLMSVDALRGFDMFWIIGADSLVYALNRMHKIPGMGFIAEQLDHAEWDGFHFYDLIFPMFVFIMGVSVVFSLLKHLRQEGLGAAVKRVVGRSVLLFAIALIYSGGSSAPFAELRLLGVLNRIALCYFFGSLIFLLFHRHVAVMVGIAAALLIGYWALLTYVPFPDVRPKATDTVITRDNYSKVSELNMASTNMLRGSYIQGVNLTDYLDQKYLPGRKYDGTYDPEGLLSTMPAVVSCLLGIFAGLLLRNPNICDSRKVIYLISFGIVSVIVGSLWGLQFPIIKKIWSSSFVLVAGGYSAILLGTFYLVVEVLKYRAWCQPFVWMGMNSITVYLASNFLGGFRKLGSRLVGGDIRSFFEHHVCTGFGDLVVALMGLTLAFWFVHFLYKRKIFLRV